LRPPGNTVENPVKNDLLPLDSYLNADNLSMFS
jgi:hypothetical protein